jgi:hypothetical protein
MKMEKVCSKCKVPKPETEFTFMNKAKGQRRSRCRTCTAEDEKERRPKRVLWERQHRAKNREYFRAKAKAERAAKPKQYKNMARKAYMRNKDKQLAARRLKAYGLTPEAFNALLASQDNRCAICRTDKPGKRNWHTDHDKDYEKRTGKIRVRGILCQNCNLALGMMHDNPGVAIKAAYYLLRENPAPIIPS